MPRISLNEPRRWVIVAFVPRMVWTAGVPRQTTTRGRMAAIYWKRNGEQVAISSGRGVRFSGGRHFTTLAM